jgi:hypothetical protein
MTARPVCARDVIDHVRDELVSAWGSRQNPEAVAVCLCEAFGHLATLEHLAAGGAVEVVEPDPFAGIDRKEPIQ